MQEPGFWDDQNRAKAKSEQYSTLKEQVDFWSTLQRDAEGLFAFASELGDTEDHAEEKEYVEQHLAELRERYSGARIEAFFSKKYDDHNVVLSIHAGAGGSDAQDWTEMLLRMYLRFCERKHFKVEVIDQSKGSDAGIKSVTLEIFGHNAYGFLRSEAGVHRLVRLSPFNPAHTRETSFSLVEVLPMMNQDDHITIDPKDLKIEANTSSGHGGQSVNTTYSAIRITHIPTGLKVSIQNERSQHQNREKAMEILYARLLALEEQRQQDERKEIRGEFHSPEWGNQIRSYVLHPYKMVKDHRTGYETADPESVLDGKLDDAIEKFLEHTI